MEVGKDAEHWDKKETESLDPNGSQTQHQPKQSNAKQRRLRASTSTNAVILPRST